MEGLTLVDGSEMNESTHENHVPWSFFAVQNYPFNTALISSAMMESKAEFNYLVAFFTPYDFVFPRYILATISIYALRKHAQKHIYWCKQCYTE